MIRSDIIDAFKKLRTEDEETEDEESEGHEANLDWIYGSIDY